MLYVVTPDRALEIIRDSFGEMAVDAEVLPVQEALGRTLAEDVVACEYVPGFMRSTVDGYAVYARDTFGSSESLPAILPVAGEVRMGLPAPPFERGTCLAVPTGGEVPDGADAVVMVEDTESYGDGTIGVLRPVAPGENLIMRGEDASPGDVLLEGGHVVTPHDIGALAALGISSVKVRRPPFFAIISTGDELVAIEETPGKGQVRDVNTVLLQAAVRRMGAVARPLGIVRDSEEELSAAIVRAVSECDAVLVSGGSSVGEKDLAARVLGRLGEILFHGVAMKPGKPTMLARVGGKPVMGLPGHPAAAYIAAHLFVRPLIGHMMGRRERRFPVPARLGEAVSSNHGREEYVGVLLEESGAGLTAMPVRGKSGLIARLLDSDGFISIPRDCEGVPKGAEVSVTLWE